MLRHAVLFNTDAIFVEIPEDKFRQGLVEFGGESAGIAFDKFHKELEKEARRR
jgi:hypothetical protein